MSAGYASEMLFRSDKVIVQRMAVCNLSYDWKLGDGSN